AIFYDITWMGFCGEPTESAHHVFEVVKGARDAAIDFVQSSAAAGREMRGFEVDDAARSHIRSMGFGDKFVHRTGPSTGAEVHGTGANMDNLQTHDERRILPGSLFSIEPGIYLPEFGVRSEINMYVTTGKAVVTGAVQQDLVRIV